ncbi:GpE family phage tail protein [Escherichia coli]|nr:GpE family phage tail protein [Escherichia coli]
MLLTDLLHGNTHPMSLTELITWREKALRRSGNTNE